MENIRCTGLHYWTEYEVQTLHQEAISTSDQILLLRLSLIHSTIHPSSFFDVFTMRPKQGQKQVLTVKTPERTSLSVTMTALNKSSMGRKQVT